MHSLRRETPETVVTADIVFAFKPDEDDAAYESLGLKGDERLVAVAPRPWFDHEDEYIEKLAWVLDELIEQRGVTAGICTDGTTLRYERLEESNGKDETCRQRRVYSVTHFTPNEFYNFIRQD